MPLTVARHSTAGECSTHISESHICSAATSTLFVEAPNPDAMCCSSGAVAQPSASQLALVRSKPASSHHVGPHCHATHMLLTLPLSEICWVSAKNLAHIAIAILVEKVLDDGIALQQLPGHHHIRGKITSSYKKLPHWMEVAEWTWTQNRWRACPSVHAGHVASAPVVVVGVNHEGKLLLAAHGDGLFRAHKQFNILSIRQQVSAI